MIDITEGGHVVKVVPGGAPVVLEYGNRQLTFLLEPDPYVKVLAVSDPRVVAMATRGYAGEFSNDLTGEEMEHYWEQLDLTKLKTPLEMVNVSFLLRGVTRSFTHQLVRYRIGASFVQESLRFSVQDKATILVPRSIILNDAALEQFINTSGEAMEVYWAMIDAGIPTEDARAILPHNITTNVFCHFALSTLVGIYTQRTCCQAQAGEWGTVMKRLKQGIGFHHPRLRDVLRSPWEVPGSTGCGFGAEFDRPCIHQAAFDRNQASQQTAWELKRQAVVI